MMPDRINQTTIIEESPNLWGTDHKPAGCTICRRVFLVPAVLKDDPCPLCYKGKLEAQPARIRPEAPEKLLTFRIGKADLHAIFTDVTSGIWIRPDDFSPDILLKRTRQVFWPLWLVDSDIRGHWQMEAGFDYQVESTREVYSGSQWNSRKQIENRVRWEPRLGELNLHIDNITVPALEEQKNRDQMTGQYHLDQAQVFDSQQLGHTVLEVSDLPPEDAWPLAVPQINKTAGQICMTAAGAQHQRNFAAKADYENLHWTQFLLPMYTTYYFDDEGHHQILVVNGQTGSIQGPRLASRKKGLRIAGILAGVAGGLFLLTLIGLVLMMVFPPAGLIAAFLGVLGLGVGIAAIIPAVWPVQWNRKQEGPCISTGR